MNQPQQKISAPLGDLRERIDDIDGKLSALIDERMTVADEVGARKRRLGLAVHALKREEALLARITSGRDPETSHVLHSVYEVLIAGSRRQQLSPILAEDDLPEKGNYEARLPVLPGESPRSSRGASSRKPSFRAATPFPSPSARKATRPLRSSSPT